MTTRKKKVVIIGGGTAGLTMASRLADRFSITVLEKSEFYSYPMRYSVPLMIGLLLRSIDTPFVKRRWITAPCERIIPFFESNMLGGASVINGCVHTIGSRHLWENFLRRFDLNYEEVLQNCENLFSIGREEIGKITLKQAPTTFLDQLVCGELEGYGLKRGDTSFSDTELFGSIYNTVGKRRRSSVLNLAGSKKLDIRIGSAATDLVLSADGKVVGVDSSRGSIATDYTILSAGVIGSCSFLMKQCKVMPEKDSWPLKKVGSGIADHVNLRVNVLTKRAFGSLNEISPSFLDGVALYLKHWLGFSTLMTTTGATTCVQLDLDKDGIVDTKINLLHFSEDSRHGSNGTYFHKQPGFSLSITPISPRSRGRISQTEEGIIVDPNYLSEKADIDLLELALTWCLQFLGSSAIREFVATIIDQKMIIEQPRNYIRENIYSGHHLVGGTHDVIDEKFECNGLPGLFICDASIMPHHFASNIHASVVLLADIFSNRFIKALG